MRILIVEDQESLAKLLKKGFEKEGYAADYLIDGEAGYKRLLMHHKDYDVAVLDLMLPGKSGFEICKNIRKSDITLPIIILTAKDSLEDKVSLLDVGADDYLVKPFEFSELLARVRALSRRPTVSVPTELYLQDIVLNPATKTVKSGGKEVKMTLTEFRLLEYLIRNSHRIIEREDIVNNIWDFNFDSFSNIVDVYVNRLRNKLDKSRSKQLIETVHGVGYKINAT